MSNSGKSTAASHSSRASVKSRGSLALVFIVVFVFVLFLGLTYYTHSLLSTHIEGEQGINNNAFIVNNLRIGSNIKNMEVI